MTAENTSGENKGMDVSKYTLSGPEISREPKDTWQKHTRSNEVLTRTYGSSMKARFSAAGSCAGLSTMTMLPSAECTLYTTLGAVMIRFRLYSRSNRSCMPKACASSFVSRHNRTRSSTYGASRPS